MNASHPAVGPGQSYRPIDDYAVLGDGLTAVLVAPDGSIDWACCPRFDSPSVFARLLDARRGGCWRIEPVAPYRVRRRYLPDTNVLETTFTTAEGEAALLDAMPPCYGRRDRAGASTVVRVLRGQGGRLPFRVVFDPRFDYARAEPIWTVQPGCGAVAAHGGADLTLLTRVQLAAASSGEVAGDGVVQAGEEVPFILAWREPPRHFWPSGLLARAPQHFVYSRALCWLAIDRGLALARANAFPADLAQWEQTRAAICTELLERGYRADLGAFVQAYGGPHLDASALALLLRKVLPADDPRMRSTVDRVVASLGRDGLVYRYAGAAEDGLPGGEGAFVMCSFWVADCYAELGHLAEARALFEQLLGHANDVGLYAEELDPASGHHLGNFPQAFSHVALINAAVALAEAEARHEQPVGRLGTDVHA